MITLRADLKILNVHEDVQATVAAGIYIKAIALAVWTENILPLNLAVSREKE